MMIRQQLLYLIRFYYPDCDMQQYDSYTDQELATELTCLAAYKILLLKHLVNALGTNSDAFIEAARVYVEKDYRHWKQQSGIVQNRDLIQ